MAITERHLKSRSSRLSLAEMVGLYDACIQLREISKQQLDLADEMALIATNAEIAAAKSQLNKEAFIVLAYETGQIARLMGQAVSGLQEDADVLARTSLVGLEKTRQLDRLQEGLAGIRSEGNAAHVGRVVDSLQETVLHNFGTLRAKLEHLSEAHRAIARHLVKVARIITYFRIEASRDDQYGAYFRNIADDLTTLCQTAHQVSAAMQGVLDRAPA